MRNVVRAITEPKFQLLRGCAEGLADVDLIDLLALREGGATAPGPAMRGCGAGIENHCVIASHVAGDPLCVPLLGRWLVAFGCIRLVHLERSVVTNISQSTVHRFCDRGKQSSKGSLGLRPPLLERLAAVVMLEVGRRRS